MARPKKFVPQLDTMENIQVTLQEASELLASGRMTTPVHRQLMENCKEARRVLESNKAPEQEQDNTLEIIWNEAPTDTVMAKLLECLQKDMTLLQAYHECLDLNSKYEGEQVNEF